MRIVDRLPCTKGAAFILLMIGTLSVTQVSIVGKLGIAEFLLFVAAPFSMMRNFTMFRRDGIIPILVLASMWCIGTCVADVNAHTPLLIRVKGLATPLIVLAMIVSIYPMLRKNPGGLKWMVFGFGLSMIINIFIFQTGGANDTAAELGMDAAVSRVVNYKLFWVARADAFLGGFVRGWYLQLPTVGSVGILLTIAALALYVGGRSAFFIPMVALFMVVLVRKNINAMKGLKKHFVSMIIFAVVASMAAFYGYKLCAKYGIGMKDAQHERERAVSQSDRNVGNRVLALLMGGRAEFFIGLIAALDKPIIGHGTYAIDTKGYRQEFISKYGNDRDIELFRLIERSGRIQGIPAHSHIIQAWMCNGIWGLVFWVYVLGLVVSTFRSRMGVVPEYYGYLALEIPAAVWHIPFSPFGNRPFMVTFICVMLLVRAIDRENRRRWGCAG